MANDPNRDLLPVKDVPDKNKGVTDKFDFGFISKMKRYELEDKYLRLCEENTELKKQIHFKDEKLKRLGTKLLRVVSERRQGVQPATRRQLDDCRTIDELQMRIVELEHDNYSLRDRNTVLKQQLATHARQHVAAHRSPVRSVHTTNSPRISHRQSSAPNINESSYILSNRQQPTDRQLREAENHIERLNDEIKTLNERIDSLQQELENSRLENQRSKVSENIELIRLKRSLKQQAAQVAALQAQARNSDNQQKTLRENLAKAHRESEDAVNIIAEKQKEILELHSKLEKNSINQLEYQELQERLNDLIKEREILKERADALLKAAASRTAETESENQLKKLLAAERDENESLKKVLETTRKLLEVRKVSERTSASETRETINKSTQTESTPSTSHYLNISGDPLEILKKAQRVIPSDNISITRGRRMTLLPADNPNDEMIIVKDNSDNSIISEDSCCKGVNHHINSSDNLRMSDETKMKMNDTEEKLYLADKLTLQRELDYTKDMLRTQTGRCEAQIMEIQRLQNELSSQHDKFDRLADRLDEHSRLFQRMEEQFRQVPVERLESNIHQLKERRHSEDGQLMKMSDSSIQRISRRDSDAVDKQSHQFLDQKFIDTSEDDLTDRSSSETKQKKGSVRGTYSQDIEDKKREFKLDDKVESTSTGTPNQMTEDRTANGIDTEGACQRPVPKPRTNQGTNVKRSHPHAMTEMDVLSSGSQVDTTRTAKVEIRYFTAEPTASMWKSGKVKMIFIEFSFLGYKGEETETPNSCPIPDNLEDNIVFDFVKTIEVTDGMIQQLHDPVIKSNKPLLTFTVVSEPPDEEIEGDDQSQDEENCEDIGSAEISIDELSRTLSEDIITLPVKSLQDSSQCIGTLAVVVHVPPSFFSLGRNNV